MNKNLSIIVSLFVISSCSNLNQQYKDEYHREQKVRHGIVPSEKVQTTIIGKQNPLEPKDLDAIGRGKIIFEKHCQDCHGATGVGDGPLALDQLYKPANLRKTVADVPHFKFFMSFSQKQGDMPGWKTNLSESERNDVAEYIKTFK